MQTTPVPEASVSRYTVDIDLLSPDHSLNQPQIWHRQPGEPLTAYQYFKIFLRLGEGLAKERTLNRVAKQTRRAASYIGQLSFTYNWTIRAKAYDKYWLDREDQARKAAIDENERQWAARTKELRETEWQMSQAMLEKVRQMLRVPLFRETIEETIDGIDPDGRIIIKQVIINEPLDWGATDIARFFEVASKMARLATGQETERKKLKIDVTRMSDEELDEIIANS